MSKKPKISPAEGWGIIVTPTLLGEVIALTGALTNPDGRVVAQVVVGQDDDTLGAATLRATKLLREMMRIDGSPEPSTSSAPAAEDFPEPKPEPEPEPEPDLSPLNGGSRLADQPLGQGNENKPTPDGPPSEADVSALHDACEAEGVTFSRPATREQAVDWLIGIREGRYTTLPPAEAEEPEETEEAEEVSDD